MAKLIERSVPRPLIKDNGQDLLKDQKVISVKIWASHIAKNTMLYPIILLCFIFSWEIWFLWFFTVYLIFLAFGKALLIGWRIYSLMKIPK